MNFQRVSIVRLCSPAAVPPDSPDDERIQAEHIAYLTGLREKDHCSERTGPVQRLPRFRGMSIYTVDVEEARAYAHQDPAVRAGWFEVVVDSWWLPSVPVTLGNRVDIQA